MHDFDTTTTNKTLINTLNVSSIKKKAVDLVLHVRTTSKVRRKRKINHLIRSKHDAYRKHHSKFGTTQGLSVSTPLDVSKLNMKDKIELMFPLYMRRTRKDIVTSDKDRIRLQRDFTLNETKRKLILLYYFDRITTDKRLKELKCKVNNCTFSRKPEDYENADAVLFKEIPAHLQRPVRKPDQVWIYVQLESPEHSPPVPQGKIVNWSATYRTDSVIPTPYEMFQLHQHPSPQVQFHHKETPSYKNYAKGKTRLIAWFVSNCRARNNRLEYVKKLQKYIQVDIYGGCGTMKCPNRQYRDCNVMLKKDYKFYLAFENSNCKDYVTEKLFNALR